MADQTINQIWKQARGELQLQLTPDIFEMYIHPARPLDMDMDEETLTVGCPNVFVRDWLEMRLNRVVSRTIAAMVGRPLAIRYVLDDQQMRLAVDVAAEPAALVRPGDLRQAGFVMLWHDLRMFYGPMIGLAGVGLWAEFRAALQGDDRHPLHGYAWLGLRSLAEHYTDGRHAVTQAVGALRSAGLVDWRTGGELAALWERQKVAGVPDSQNDGVSGKVLARLLSDPVNSRVYSVSDPLELPEFCTTFERTILLDVTAARCGFEGYAGRISARWQDWLKRLMAANGLTRIEPDDWFRLGLQ